MTQTDQTGKQQTTKMLIDLKKKKVSNFLKGWVCVGNLACTRNYPAVYMHNVHKCKHTPWFISDKSAAKQLNYNNNIFISGGTKSSLYQRHICCNVAPPQAASGEGATSNAGTQWQRMKWSVCVQVWPKRNHPCRFMKSSVYTFGPKDEQGQIKLIWISSSMNDTTDWAAL